MLKIFITLLFGCMAGSLLAQSNTTQTLHKKYDDAFYLYFYENTLRMINQDDNPEFASLIDNIEKMKFLKLDENDGFSVTEYPELLDGYKEEAFEELMTMRQNGSNINVLIKEKDKVTLGLVMLIRDETSLSILDIKGSVPLNQLVSLYDKVKNIN